MRAWAHSEKAKDSTDNDALKKKVSVRVQCWLEAGGINGLVVGAHSVIIEIDGHRLLHVVSIESDFMVERVFAARVGQGSGVGSDLAAVHPELEGSVFAGAFQPISKDFKGFQTKNQRR